jgi:hypothetical protein
MIPSRYNDLFIGSVFTVKLRGERGKFTKACPGFALDGQGKEAIFHPNTPIRLVGRVKLCVLDYS